MFDNWNKLYELGTKTFKVIVDLNGIIAIVIVYNTENIVIDLMFLKQS